MNRPERIPLRSDPAAARSHGVNMFVRLVTTELLRFKNNPSFPETFDEVLREYWPSEQRREIELLQRAASAPANTTTAAWAGVLSQTASREFLMSLGPVSAGATLLRRCLTFDFGNNKAIKVPSVVSAATGSAFVKEGDPIAVESFSLSSVTLTPTSLKTISTFTRETLRLTLPSIETMVRTVLTESIGHQLDSVLFSNAAAVADTKPAGLLNGLSNLTASTDTIKSEALAQDVRDLVSAVAPVSGNNPVFLVAAPKQAAALKLYLGPNPVFEVFATSGLSAGSVIAVGSNCIASAVAPALDIDVTYDGGAFQLDDASPAAGLLTASPVRSPFQTDTLACRLMFDVSWALRSSTGLAFMTGVSW